MKLKKNKNIMNYKNICMWSLESEFGGHSNDSRRRPTAILPNPDQTLVKNLGKKIQGF